MPTNRIKVQMIADHDVGQLQLKAGDVMSLDESFARAHPARLASF